MKVFVLAPREDWICDRLVYEWYENNPDIATKDPNEADIIWVLADWAWTQIPTQLLKTKKVVTSIHHIVPNKFGATQLHDFSLREQITDFYHVPCAITKCQVEKILSNLGSSKQILTQPFWVNDRIWTSQEKLLTRQKMGLKSDAFYIGSFQRDTEGHDLVSPKLEKGPDQFCDVVEHIFSQNNRVEVLLGGWRRQYVMKRLTMAKIPFTYFELPDQQTINSLYACLDAYVVAARFEGGPQAIVECAAVKTPVLSTLVGLAPEILHNDSIFEMNRESIFAALANSQLDEAKQHAFTQVNKHFLQNSFPTFRKFLANLHEKT